MANIKFSALPAAATPTGTETTVGLQSAAAVQFSPYTTQPSGDASLNLATTAFVAAAIAPLNPASAVNVATTAVLPNTPTYNNGTAGVGATLTAGSNTTLTVDSVGVTLNQRVLVKNQASTFQNGIYSLTQLGSGSVPWILTRATDYNSPQNINYTGTVPIIAGTVNAGTNWLLTSTIAAVGSPNAITYVSQSATLPKGTLQTADASLPFGALITGGGGYSTHGSTALGTSGQILTSNGAGLGPTFSGSIASGITATTQTAGDNSTKIATTAYVATAVNGGTNNPGSAFSVPALGGFTGVNLTGATASATQAVSGGPILVRSPSIGSLNWFTYTIALPSTPFKIKAQIVRWATASNSSTSGMYFYDGTKLMGLEMFVQGAATQFRVEKITNVTTDGSTATLIFSPPYMIQTQFGSPWIQLRDDGTKIWFDVSWDGLNFVNIFNENVGTFITPTNIGFGGLNAGSGTDQYIWVQNWSQVANANLNAP